MAVQKIDSRFLKSYGHHTSDVSGSSHYVMCVGTQHANKSREVPFSGKEEYESGWNQKEVKEDQDRRVYLNSEVDIFFSIDSIRVQALLLRICQSTTVMILS